MKLEFFFCTFLMILLSSCASAPKNPKACKVWSDETNFPDSVYVENEAAFFGAGCITGRYGCKWKEATFEGNDIVVNGELSGVTGKVLTYKDGKLTTATQSNLLSKVIGKALSQGTEYQFQPDRVVITSKLTSITKAINRGNDTKTVNVMHSNCAEREAALGTAFILAGRR
jgi:hypothetical protein